MRCNELIIQVVKNKKNGRGGGVVDHTRVDGRRSGALPITIARAHTFLSFLRSAGDGRHSSGARNSTPLES